MQEFDVFDAVADVAGVTMKPNQGGSSLAMGNEPTVETKAISRCEKHVFEIEPDSSRRLFDGGAGIKNELIFDPASGGQQG
jgi:hypothetical protein